MGQSNNEIIDYIIDIMRGEFDTEGDIDKDTDIQNVLDSMDIVNLLFKLEGKYKVKIPDEALENQDMLIIVNMANYIIKRL